MKTDMQLKADVLAELKWEPSINEKLISVEVDNGVATLLGHVDSYDEKQHTLEAVKRVQGLKALSDEIDVALPNLLKREDLDIAKSAKDLLKWMTYFPKGRVTVVVQDAKIILNGELDWDFQSYVVANSMRHLMGVTAVINQISIKPKASWSSIQTDAEQAINTQIAMTSNTTSMDISDSRVTLTLPTRGSVERILTQQSAYRVAKPKKKIHPTTVVL